MTTIEPYLTTADMAEATGKTSEWWARVCKSGAIDAIKLGNDWRVAPAVFEAFMRGGQKAVARPGRTARQRRRSA